MSMKPSPMIWLWRGYWSGGNSVWIHTDSRFEVVSAAIITVAAISTPTITRWRSPGAKIARNVVAALSGTPRRSASARRSLRALRQRSGSGMKRRMTMVMTAGATPTASTQRQPCGPTVTAIAPARKKPNANDICIT